MSLTATALWHILHTIHPPYFARLFSFSEADHFFQSHRNSLSCNVSNTWPTWANVDPLDCNSFDLY